MEHASSYMVVGLILCNLCSCTVAPLLSFYFSVLQAVSYVNHHLHLTDKYAVLPDLVIFACTTPNEPLICRNFKLNFTDFLQKHYLTENLYTTHNTVFFTETYSYTFHFKHFSMLLTFNEI